ncbi:MAG: ATP-binding protein [Saprospiraceae bacterium]|nr:ATP-binding protein [Saprospiraceae bacterium]
MQLIGRKEEQKTFKHMMQSTESKLVAVYGRRRIGKTFLIRKYFDTKFTFEIVGLHNGNMKDQIRHFVQTLVRHGYAEAMVAHPDTWMETFDLFSLYLNKLKGKEKKVIFFDELPWFDTPRSKFLMAFEHFWNAFCTKRSDILLIICGSSASWMIKKILQNKGGLHNRISEKMQILPFTLSETKLFLNEKGIKWSMYDIAQLYMTMGGIPYYLDAVRKGESVVQCIDRLCFQKTGLMYNEFEELYTSLFSNSDNHKKIISILASSKGGMTRDELIIKSKLPSGGNLTSTMDELVKSNFIIPWTPYGMKQNKLVFKIEDFFTLFYFKFMHDRSGRQQENWTKLVKNQSWVSWSGFAFEKLCFTHTDQIKKALGLSVIQTQIYGWKSQNDDEGAQIDLIIDRADNIIHLCEIKFCNATFVIDKSYAAKLRNKVASFSKVVKKKTLFLTMVTTFGTLDNEYYKELVQNEVTLEDIF